MAKDIVHGNESDPDGLVVSYRVAPAETTGSAHIIAALQELIDGIDSRVPQVDRAGDTQIAKDAAALRLEGVNRIEELTRT
jgi:hypothetical protein